jgi:hypothetical protein
MPCLIKVSLKSMSGSVRPVVIWKRQIDDLTGDQIMPSTRFGHLGDWALTGGITVDKAPVMKPRGYAACQKCFTGPTLYDFARSHVLHSDFRENTGSMFSAISRDSPPDAYIS